jgi:hypothetical protein
VIFAILDRARGAFGMPPIRVGHVLKPLGYSAASAHVGGHDEDDGSWSRQLLRLIQARVGGTAPLRDGAVTCGSDELCKLRIRDFVTVDPKSLDTHEVSIALLGSLPVGPHRKRSAGDERHACAITVLGWAEIGAAGPRLMCLRDGAGRRQAADGAYEQQDH